MENLDEKSRKKDVSDSVTTESREKSGSACSNGRLSFHYSSSAQFGLPIGKTGNCLKNEEIKSPLNVETVDKSRIKKQGPNCSDIEMMKERFAKLLLGEDMSGNGKGVCSALTISNAITNLCATVFGQLWRLEPLPCEKKSMWRREMGWLLSVTDHIVELKPSWQTFPDGSQVEVMSCQPRSDLLMNLPALEKLDNMLLEILDGFCDREFWYVDQGIVAAEGDDGSVSLKKAVQRQEEKWWLPVPRVPHGGLPECARKELVQKLESANQILKAATAINCIALAEMEVPESYLETLPKNGRGCVGDVVHRYMSSNHFSSECLLDFLDLCSEHAALEMANRVEAAIHVWRTRQTTRHSSSAKSSLAQRAQTLLQALKHRFPGLTQTTLDTAKIQHNKDVGKSILESYSRVLESLAFNIVARIEDLLYVDDINKQQSDKLSMKIPLPRGSPYRTPNPSPTPATTPSPRNINSPRLKRVLTNYLLADANT